MKAKTKWKAMKQEAIDSCTHWLISTGLFSLFVPAGLITWDLMWTSQAAVAGYMLVRLMRMYFR